jgi:glucose-1-phosphate adenylyltransferase
VNQARDCVAMLLAGGEGRRLGMLTRELAKPAVPFGGKYRVIDFTLSNCTNSGILTVGVLTQYQPLILNSHIGIGIPWDLDRKDGGVTVLPPFVDKKGGEWYKGTADAIFQNLFFIERYDPRYVLVISGDHIYKMDYSRMLKYHQDKQADVTIAVIEVPWTEASRFGIMNAAEDGRIEEFEEKPEKPRNNLASMGIYMFDRETLQDHLHMDQANPSSSNDFGKNVIPQMLQAGCRMFAYLFRGYWKDVGTLESFWEANMDLLQDHPELDLNDRSWPIYTVNPNQPPHYIDPAARVKRSLINEGCMVFGQVEHSILFPGVQVGKGSILRDSIIMSGTTIGTDVLLERAIIGENVIIGNDCYTPSPSKELIVVRENSMLPDNSAVESTLNGEMMGLRGEKK